MRAHGNNKDLRLQEYRALDKELDELYEAQDNLGYYPLKKPIRHGWYKYLKLRDDVARRKDAYVFQNIIDVAGITIWGRKVEEVDQVWVKRNADHRRISLPGIRKLDRKEFQKLIPKAQRYFEGIEISHGSWLSGIIRYHCRVPKHYFEPTYKRAYITHRKIIDSEIESRIDQLENRLLRPEFYTHHHWHYPPERWLRKHWRRGKRRSVKTSLSKYDHTFDDFQLPQDAFETSMHRSNW